MFALKCLQKEIFAGLKSTCITHVYMAVGTYTSPLPLASYESSLVESVFYLSLHPKHCTAADTWQAFDKC